MKNSNVANSQFPLQLPGYTLTELLYSGSRTCVSRGVQHQSQQSVIIKMMKQSYPTFGELVQFRNQYTVAKNLDLPGIVQPLSLEPLGNGYALIMEDGGKLSLNHYLQEQTLNLADVLAIALQLTDILHDLHQQQVIHKDIKPANILIHPESKQVKLIDFSIASLLPKETQEIQNPNVLEGTLAYLAPEQTGRMNRGIDYRADFYALGVTLYQLLSEQLPFESNDAMELVHSHIAKVPVPIEHINPAIPSMVGAIVSKLMAKNAEDRYQSALGLKYDLQQCLSQWETTGEIETFELGQKDLSDRFLISEKLYGREAEVQALLQAFDRISQEASELMLVAGFSGIGKTAVVNEVHKPITRQKGYFIKGKFDQLNRNIPLSAFVQALRDLMGKLLCESDAQLAQWKTQILEAVGESGQVLIEVIPELEQVIGQQPPAPELSGTAAQNRFNLLFQKFIQVFTTVEHPLVVFLDDLQWADLASLQLLKVLMDDNGYLLVLGAYRDNEVSPVHPLMLAIADLKKAALTVNTLTLAPLAPEQTNHLIADTLKCSTELAQPLTQLIDRKTQGNPFFTTQFLKTLHEDGYITFNRKQGYWQCDIAQVNALALTDDVVEFMTLQLQKLPAATQQMLQLAACIGNQFDLATLAIVSEQSQTDTATALWKALQESLIIPISDTYKFFQSQDSEPAQPGISVPYKFLHDRVQQAAYSLIQDDHKQTKHLQIGKLLLKSSSDQESRERLFEIVNHLNMGIDLITDATEQQTLIELNWQACQKAKENTAYTLAHQYATIAQRLLGVAGWQQQYGLTLTINNALAELNLLMGNFAAMEQTVDTILAKSSSLLAQITAYKTRIQGCFFQNQMETGISIGIEVLQKLGVDISVHPPEVEIARFLERGREITQGISIPDLLDLPAMEEQEALAISEIATNIVSPSYITNPPLFLVLINLLVELSICHGNTAGSAYSYGCYGVLTCNLFKDIETGVSFGRLAAALDQHSVNATLKGRGMMILSTWLEHRKTHLNNTLEILSTGYQMSLNVGDLEFVGHNAHLYCLNSFWCGYPLQVLQTELDAYLSVLSDFNQAVVENYVRLIGQTCANLLGSVQQPDVLQGNFVDETECVPYLIEHKDILGLGLFYLNKLFLCFLFDQSLLALDHRSKIQECLVGLNGLILEAEYYFYDSLVLLATISSEVQDDTLTQVSANQFQLQEYWAKYAPMNHQHKVHLVEAEKVRVMGDRASAIELYDQAIAGAKANDYIQEEALANELAAKFYLGWGKEKVAAGYIQEAYYGYAKWGAKAKVADLERRYPQLLQPILQDVKQPLTVLETLASIAAPTYSIHSTLLKQSSSSINQTLDFATLLQVSQTFASTIALDELLKTLAQTMLENSGADRCSLILCESNQWQVRVMATLEQVTLQSALLENNPNVPVNLIQYVKNTMMTVVMDDLDTNLPVIGDYLHRYQPKSALCLPILNQGNLRAILYLENRSTSGVFTGDRIAVLNFLCTQAAISLENAKLYQQAQSYAHQLEQSQLQIVESEKMASLGNLVAGVAHEINNPIGFLNGSIDNSKDYVQDLLDYIALYQQHHPNPAAPVQDKAEDIDLEFLSEDLPKLLNSMQNATDRIKSISTSLRTFSRADKEYKVKANIHEGIDSTLLILKYRLKANACRPEIEVINNYADMPKINCFPGQLNQVFMNILANAIDVFDEMTKTRSFKELEADPQKIMITTSMANNQVQISIRDNGNGMSEDVKTRIFDHLFTTKAVGKGTGLGLAIARQIVVDKHGGHLDVQSQLGQGTEFCIRLPL